MVVAETLVHGSPVAEIALPVEAGLVMLFARAIGDPNPLYRSGSAAAVVAGAAIAPPTFAMAADAFDAGFERRPPVDAAARDERPATVDALLHVSQDFTYARAVRVGETLAVRRLPPRCWQKTGRRGGALEFVEATTELVDADGQVIVSSTWTDVRPERGHREMSVGPSVGTGTGTGTAAGSAAPSASDREEHSAPDGGDGVLVVRELTRTRIAMYVGVAGDLHPLHHDEVYARAHGYPSVFAPGMLTMAMTGRAVTDRVGPGNLRAFGGRLTGQVWPGDSLWTAVRPEVADAADAVDAADAADTADAADAADVADVVDATNLSDDGEPADDGTASPGGASRYQVETWNQDGRTVFIGRAEARGEER